MNQSVMSTLRRPLALAAFGAVLVATVGLARPAQARVWIGFGFPLYLGPPAYYAPPPVYYPPPAYYPPPVAYPPPPAYYAQPGQPYAQPPAQYRSSAQSCVTEGVVCPMERPVATGSSCYCTTGQGRLWGHAT